MAGTTEPSTEAPPPVTSEREAALEDRIRKLEAALAERAATPDDESVTERVIAKLSSLAGGARAAADRVLVLAGDSQQYDMPPAPPHGAVLRPPEPPGDPAQRRWFFWQLWAEVRMIFRMYFDPHYRVSRTTQFAIPGILLLLVFDYFFFSVWVSIIFVSPITERVLAVLLGVLGYKLLVRELGRYRDVLEYLARYGPR